MQQGLVVKSHGRHFTIEIDNHQYQATAKGKRTEYVVGDIVTIQVSNNEQANIIDLVPRRNLIYRSDHNRSKIIASNLDQLIIVIAVKPNFNIHFLDSCLLCAEASSVEPIIVINKMDIKKSQEFTLSIKQLYQEKLGYQVLTMTALENCTVLENLLDNKRSLLIGQSGVGKSTITNQVYPQALARTGEIAKHEHSGSHTTTHATLYRVNKKTELIDCPGLQEFGLYHLELTQVPEYFPEMLPFLGSCRFNNCIHLNEPDCAIQRAATDGRIESHRYNFYCRLIETLKTKKNY
jgi:ribosome biogenesis GTPase